MQAGQLHLVKPYKVALSDTKALRKKYDTILDARCPPPPERGRGDGASARDHLQGPGASGRAASGGFGGCAAESVLEEAEARQDQRFGIGEEGRTGQSDLVATWGIMGRNLRLQGQFTRLAPKKELDNRWAVVHPRIQSSKDNTPVSLSPSGFVQVPRSADGRFVGPLPLRPPLRWWESGGGRICALGVYIVG